MICPQCGRSNDEDNRYCPECGTHLKELSSETQTQQRDLSGFLGPIALLLNIPLAREVVAFILLILFVWIGRNFGNFILSPLGFPMSVGALIVLIVLIQSYFVSKSQRSAYAGCTTIILGALTLFL